MRIIQYRILNKVRLENKKEDKNINLRLNVRHDWLVGQLEDPLDTDSSHFGALVPL